MTIGVFGRWGSGKTSLMRLIEATVKSDHEIQKCKGVARKPDRVETLWINVWQLSNQKQLWNVFLQTLLTQVRDSLRWYHRPGFDWSLLKERVKWRALLQTLLANSYRIVITVTPILLAALSSQAVTQPGDFLNFLSNLGFSGDTVIGGGASLILALWLLVRPAVEAAKEKVSLDLGTVLKDAPYEAQI